MRPGCLIYLVLGLACAASWAAADDLRVGRAAVDITPPEGTPLLTPQRPPFEVKLAGAPHDPLHVKAIVMEAGGQRAALVTCDLTSIPLQMIQEARRQIGETTDVEPANVMISATHCHTAPQIRSKYLGKADETARRKADEYIAALPAKMAEAVALAEADLQAATIAAALGVENSVSFNRRFFLRDGTVMANPFKGEDEKLGQVLRPAGPTDPELGVLRFATPAREPLAVLLNFAIHLDTMGGEQPSADFPYLLSDTFRTVYGPQVLTYWSSGASGNINHYDLMDPKRVRREKGPHEAARIGTILAAAALRTYAKAEPQAASPLQVAHELVRVDYHPEKAAALMPRMKGTPRYFDGEVDVINDNGRLVFDAEVQVITLGNELAWVGLPGEMFTELGLSLKQASPFKYTFVQSLANGAIGYVPNMRSYPEGAREAEATRCAPGSGERLIDSAVKMLIKLKSQLKG